MNAQWFHFRKPGKVGWGLVALVVVVAVVVLLAGHAQKHIKAKLEGSLGKHWSIGSVSMGFRSIDFLDIRFRDPSGRETLYAKEVSCGFRLFDLIMGRKVVRQVAIQEPRMHLEIDPKGRIIGPIPISPSTREAAEKKNPSWILDKVMIRKGAFDFVDRRGLQSPVDIRVRDLELTLQNLAVPGDGRDTRYQLTAAVPGRASIGHLQSRGRIQFGGKHNEHLLKLKNLDITEFESYYRKDYPVALRRGFLDMDMDIQVTDGKINASGEAVLRDLSISDKTGIGERFLGIPLSMLAVFLERNDHQIPVRFTLTGDIKNPMFNLRENLVREIASGMADTVGSALPLPGRSKYGTITSKIGRWGERIKKGLLH